MNEIALVTANFGRFDDLKVLPQHEGIDAFYYTDEATRAKASAASLASWTSVLVPNYPRIDFGSRLRAKYFKLQIQRLDEAREHPWLAWVDASLQLHETRFICAAVERLKRLPPAQRLLLVPHPDRRTVLEEYQYLTSEMEGGNEYLQVRYADEKMSEQMAWYREQGYPLGARLWCGGFFVIENSELFRRCWNDWWHHNIRFGVQDQLSLPICLGANYCEPQLLDVHMWKNRHFTGVSHQSLR